MATLPTNFQSGDTGHVDAHNETNTEVNTINDALTLLNSLAEYFVNANPTLFLNAKADGSVSINSNGTGNVSIAAATLWDFLIDPTTDEAALRAGDGNELSFREGHASFLTSGDMQIVATDANGISLTAPLVFIGSDLLITDPGTGLVLQAPDNSRHRLVVANDGALSTEPA